MKQNKLTQRLVLITIGLVALMGMIGFFNWRSHQKDGQAIEQLTWQPNTYVYDRADLLSDETETKLNQSLATLDTSKKAQVIVLTVDDLKGNTIQAYANTVFNQTGIGDKTTDNGLLMLIAKDEKKVWIEVGQGLEGELNDGKVGRILDEDFVPYRTKNDYDRAVSQTIGAISTVLTGQSVSEDTATQPNSSNTRQSEAPQRLPVGALILLVVVVLIVVGLIVTGNGDLLLWLIFALVNNRGGGGSGGYGGGSSSDGGGFGGGSSSGGGAGR
ncbi:MAG: TPM domain-containing protein [Streptococcaceae bacterium]|jgi:uncharacterized protein|nr:TPM domain-containing protein [Streptococcaceae bacterium]